MNSARYKHIITLILIAICAHNQQTYSMCMALAATQVKVVLLPPAIQLAKLLATQAINSQVQNKIESTLAKYISRGKLRAAMQASRIIKLALDHNNSNLTVPINALQAEQLAVKLTTDIIRHFDTVTSLATTGTCEKNLLREALTDNVLFVEAFKLAITKARVLLFTALGSSAEAYSARLAINKIQLPGAWGKAYATMVTLLNTIYFNPDGSLKAIIESEQIVKARNLFIKYLQALATSKESYLQYLTLALQYNACCINNAIVEQETKQEFAPAPDSLTHFIEKTLPQEIAVYGQLSQDVILQNTTNNHFLSPLPATTSLSADQEHIAASNSLVHHDNQILITYADIEPALTSQARKKARLERQYLAQSIRLANNTNYKTTKVSRPRLNNNLVFLSCDPKAPIKLTKLSCALHSATLTDPTKNQTKGPGGYLEIRNHQDRTRSIPLPPVPTTSLEKSADTLLYGNTPIFYMRDKSGEIVRDAQGSPAIDLSHPGNTNVIPLLAKSDPAKLARAVIQNHALAHRTDIRNGLLTLSQKLLLSNKLSFADKQTIAYVTNFLRPHQEEVEKLLAHCELSKNNFLHKFDTVEQQRILIELDTFFSTIALEKQTDFDPTYAIATMASTAYELNVANHTQQAKESLQIAKELKAFGKGLIKGAIVEPAKALYNTVRHPITTTKDILVLGFNICLLGFELDWFLSHPDEWTNEDARLRKIISSGIESLKTASTESWGSFLGSFVGLGVQNVALRNLGKLSARLGAIIEESETIQNILKAAEVVDETVAQDLALAGMPHEAIALTAAISNAEEAMKAGHAVKTHVQQFNKTLLAHKAALPYDPLLSCNQMKKRIDSCCLLYKDSHEIVAKLQELKDLGAYVKSKKLVLPAQPGFTSKPLNLMLDIDHILLPELELHKRTGALCKLNGFHLDTGNKVKALGELESKTRLVIKETGLVSNGIEEVNILFGGNKDVKSLFPATWDSKLCIDKIIESLNNIHKFKVGKCGKFIIDGSTNENIIIRSIINPKNGFIKTCYPKLKLVQ